jgi:lipopolysaccharide export system protein LptC
MTLSLTENGTRFPGVQRPAAMFAAAQRHSTYVRLLRRGLPVIMAVSILGLVVAPLINPFRGLPGLSIGPVRLSGTKVTMEKPRMTGFRKDGKPYEVTASSAQQDIRRPNVVELNEMRARLQIEGDGWANLDSRSGIFDTQKEQLKLVGDVRLKTDTGYDARLKSADVDFKAGTVISREPVRVSINNGTTTVDANQLDVTDNGKVMAFTGRVTVLIENAERGTLSGPSSGK